MDLYEQSRFSPLELEFMAENSLITISPTVSLAGSEGRGDFAFLCGRFGPLVAGVELQVPLWLAMTLKGSKKARVVMPEWMREGELRAAAVYEQATGDSFSPAIPFHYIEVAEVLLRAAEDDCAAECAASGGSLESLSDALLTLIEVREAKIHKGIQEALQRTKEPGERLKTLVIRLNGVAAMEVADMRDGFLKTLDVIVALNAAEETAAQRLESSRNRGGYRRLFEEGVGSAAAASGSGVAAGEGAGKAEGEGARRPKRIDLLKRLAMKRKRAEGGGAAGGAGGGGEEAAAGGGGEGEGAAEGGEGEG